MKGSGAGAREGKIPDLPHRDYAAVLRLDLFAFVQRCFYELNPSTEFYSNWHLELIAADLAAVQRGEIKRLNINVAPRSLKSLAASVAFPAWCLGHDPTLQIICVSYAQDLADKHARDCRTIMSSDFYQATFGTRLSPEKMAVEEFTTSHQGYRMSTSVGGTLTGRGADLIIIDDPLKPTDALSDAKRRSTNEWFDNTLYTRLNSKRKGCIVLISQRVHMDDLVGHVLEQEPWSTVSLPIIAQHDEEHVIATPYGTRKFRRRAGEALHPARESLGDIERIKRSIGEYNFAGQYLQSPTPLGGGLIKEAWFRRYAPHQKPTSFDRILQSWDTANKPTELSDYSVCTTWAIKGKDIYLIHVQRKRLAYPELKRAVREQWQAFGADVVLIEDKASGTQLIQELIQEGLHAVTAFKPKDDKLTRMNAQTATIENGFVHVPEADHWVAEYLHEVVTFPFGKHDDQVDSTSQALEWFKRCGFEPYLLQYVKQELAALGKSRSAMVRLRPPSPVTTVILIDGRAVAMEPDGTIQLTEENAAPLLRAGWTRLPN